MATENKKRFDKEYAKELTKKANQGVEELLDILYDSIEKSAEKGMYISIPTVAQFSNNELIAAKTFLASKGFAVDYSLEVDKIRFYIDWS